MRSVCDGKTIIPEVNDLASRAPKLASEWDFDKNAEITPDRIALHDNRKYHWRCSKCGHSWKASPSNRACGKGCPKCAGKIVDHEVNSFAAINPHLIDQWDPLKNDSLTAWDVAAYDNRDYYWKCDNSHSWKASPANRTKGTKCPYCTGKLPSTGVNDFATICPSVATEWHPIKMRIAFRRCFCQTATKKHGGNARKAIASAHLFGKWSSMALPPL